VLTWGDSQTFKVSHDYRSSVGGYGKDSSGQLYETGRSVSSRIQGGGGKQVLAFITLQKIECLASNLVFGPKGLVLGSSMALIPTETT